MSKYNEVYFVGDNQAINRVWVDSSKTRNQGAFSGSLAALILTHFLISHDRFSSILQLLNFIASLYFDYQCSYVVGMGLVVGLPAKMADRASPVRSELKSSLTRVIFGIKYFVC